MTEVEEEPHIKKTNSLQKQNMTEILLSSARLPSPVSLSGTQIPVFSSLLPSPLSLSGTLVPVSFSLLPVVISLPSQSYLTSSDGLVGLQALL